jgi:hypothetical protein
MNEFYSHKSNTYSYREVNNNIKHIKFCTCVENDSLQLFFLFYEFQLFCKFAMKFSI